MSSRNHCRVRAATRGDIPAMTRIRYRAFGSSTFHTRLWPEHLRVLPNKGDDQQAWLAQRTKKHFDEGNETIHYIVAVQDLPSGEEVIVGSGEWIKPAGNDDDDDDDDKTGGKEPETDRSLVTQEAELPSALDKGVLEERAEGAKILQEAAERVLGKENMKNMWCKIIPGLCWLTKIPRSHANTRYSAKLDSCGS